MREWREINLTKDKHPYNLIIFGRCADLVWALQLYHINPIVDIHAGLLPPVNQYVETTAPLVDREIWEWMALSLLLIEASVLIESGIVGRTCHPLHGIHADAGSTHQVLYENITVVNIC